MESEIGITDRNGTTQFDDIQQKTDNESNQIKNNTKHRRILLEPAVFLLYFGINLSTTVLQNQLLYQSCTTVFQYSEAQCEPMLGKSGNTSETIENEVQAYTSRIIMMNSFISSIGPAVACLFIGPWSDTYGRRPIILITSIGLFMHHFINMILALLSSSYHISPWFYLIAIIPSTVVGSNCAFLVVNYCYVADVSPAESKDVRMVFTLYSYGIGIVLANVVAGFLFDATNAPTVFAMSTVSILMSLSYSYYFAKESVEVQDASLKKKLIAVINPRLLKDLFISCCKRRANSEHFILWITMLSLIVVNFAQLGETNVFYLFLRKKFDITVTDFSEYNGGAYMMQIAGAGFAMTILKKRLGIPPLTLGVLCLFSAIAQSIIRIYAVHWWQIYLAAFVGQLCNTVYPILLAFLSQLTPPTEFGKIFALTNALETVSPLLAAPLYTSVYNATLAADPGFFNIVSACLSVACFIQISILIGIRKSQGHAIFKQMN